MITKLSRGSSLCGSLGHRLFIVIAFIYCSLALAIAEKIPLDLPEVVLTSDHVPKNEDPTKSTLVDENLGFLHAFVASLSVIVVSELGDKTFFIAAITAMRRPRLTVFAGAISALAIMTILSVLFGYAVTIIPRIYTYYVSTALFALFGLKMLKDGYYMSPNEEQQELEEVQSDLIKHTNELDKATGATVERDPETGSWVVSRKTSQLFYLWMIFLQTFTLTFLAEWGDRSQLTTIILAAREDVYGVVVGGILGHSFCTGIAVLGGRMIAQKISVRTVTLIGGVVFLIFALTALFMAPTEDI